MTVESIRHFENFHAHVYFDADTTHQARTLCARAGETFDLEVGRHHEKNVGPHPRWSCQLAFAQATFSELVTWLEDNRKELTVFIHGLSGDDLADHTEHVAWLGEAVALNLDMFKRT